MSDFVDNLVAKSLGLAEVVAPRPMSLFEPLPSDAGPLAPEYYALEQDGAPRPPPAGVEAMMDGVAPPALREDESSEKTPPALRTAQSDPPSQHSVQVVDALEQDGAPRPPPAGVEVMMDWVATPALREDEPSEKTPPALRTAQSDPPSQHPVQVVDRSASQPAPLLIPHQPAPPALVAGDADKRADRSEYAAPAGQQTVNSYPAAPESAPWRVVLPARTPADRQQTAAQEASSLNPPHAAPGRAMAPVESIASTPSQTLLISPSPDQERGSQLSDRAAAMPSAPEAEAPAAPTIKITIGRVDVRAIMPDKETPRPAPGARNTALSLDEYLKRRSGGKP